MTKRPTREDAGRTHDVPPSALPETQCWLDTCRNTGHVVLYASSDKLGGQPTTPRQPVVFCLHHGGEIYDVAHAWKNRSRPLREDGAIPYTTGPGRGAWAICPNWLIADLRNNRLPRTSPDPAGWQPASTVATARRWTTGKPR